MKKLGIKVLSTKESIAVLGGSRRRVKRAGVALRRRRSSGFADQDSNGYEDEYDY